MSKVKIVCRIVKKQTPLFCLLCLGVQSTSPLVVADTRVQDEIFLCNTVLVIAVIPIDRHTKTNLVSACQKWISYFVEICSLNHCCILQSLLLTAMIFCYSELS